MGKRVDVGTVSIGILPDTSGDDGVSDSDDPVADGMALVAEAMDGYSVDQLVLADQVRGGSGMPDRLELRDTVQAWVDSTVQRVSNLVDSISADDVPDL